MDHRKLAPLVLFALIRGSAACSSADPTATADESDGGSSTTIVTPEAPSDDTDGSVPIVAQGDASTGDARASDASILNPSLPDGSPPPATTSGKVLFVGDFETGNLSQWDYVEQCQTGRIGVYSIANAPAGAPAPRQGTYAVKFHVLDGDVKPCTTTDNPRAQLQSKIDLFRPGDEAWEAWSMYIPTDFPASACNVKANCNPYFLFQEDYGPPWDGPPSIGWDILDIGNVDSFTLSRGAQYGVDRPWHEAKITGKWTDFLVHKKFANTPSGGGFVEAWVNKTPITFANGSTRLAMQTMHSTQTMNGFFINSYRAAGMWAAADVYFDAVRVGTTRDVVEQL